MTLELRAAGLRRPTGLEVEEGRSPRDDTTDGRRATGDLVGRRDRAERPEPRSVGGQQRGGVDAYVAQAGRARGAPDLARGKRAVMLVALPGAPVYVRISPSSRDETDAPHPDMRLGQQREAIHRADVQPTAGLEHAGRLGDERVGVAAVLERAERHDALKGSIGKREVLAIAADEWRADAGALQAAARNDEPPERDVDPDHPLPAPEARKHQIGGAATDVEPPSTRRVTGGRSREPFGGARLGRHDEPGEALRLLAWRARRASPVCANGSFEIGVEGLGFERHPLLPIRFESDPRVRLQPEIGDSDHHREVARADNTLIALVRSDVMLEGSPAGRADERRLCVAAHRFAALGFGGGLLGLRGTGGHEARFNSENASTDGVGRGSPTTTARKAPQTTEMAAVT